jgi:glucarate dehydratase
VVRIKTNEGLEGIGETFRGRPTAHIIQRLTPEIIGVDPLSIESLLYKFKMVPFFYGYVGFAALAGIEMACWDLLGKASNQPLAVLLGGYVRREIAVSALVFKKPEHRGMQGKELARALAGDGKALVEGQQVKVLKLKGSHDPQQDVLNMEALEEALQGTVKLRVDPNAAWTVADTLRVLPRLQRLSMDYLEDPVEGLDAMARIRQEARMPLATNMCVVKPDDVPAAFRLGAVDVILADVHKWGGISPTRKLAGTCEFLGLSMSMHSGSELGISTAAHLHVAAATRIIDHAMDTTLTLQESDIIDEPLHDVRGGVLPVPGGPGLGVTINEEKLRYHAAQNERDGDAA